MKFDFYKNHGLLGQNAKEIWKGMVVTNEKHHHLSKTPLLTDDSWAFYQTNFNHNGFVFAMDFSPYY